MPVEAITCPGCGSNDTTEFKHDTYICAVCEKTFKWVDPSKVIVEHQNQFCTCGNSVQFRCVDCGTGVCYQHVVQNSGGFHPVTVEGSAYADHEGNQIIDLKKLDLGDRSYCQECVQHRVERTAKRLADGELCSEFHCPADAAQICPCCTEPYCEVHRYGIKDPIPHRDLNYALHRVMRLDSPSRLVLPSPGSYLDRLTSDHGVLFYGVRQAGSETERTETVTGLLPIPFPDVCVLCRCHEYLLSQEEEKVTIAFYDGVVTDRKGKVKANETMAFEERQRSARARAVQLTEDKIQAIRRRFESQREAPCTLNSHYFWVRTPLE